MIKVKGLGVAIMSVVSYIMMFMFTVSIGFNLMSQRSDVYLVAGIAICGIAVVTFFATVLPLINICKKLTYEEKKPEKNEKGFTSIEVMIVIAIILILVRVGYNGVQGLNSGNAVSSGLGGIVEERCIGGYKHTVSNGQARQIMDEYGKGVKCYQ